MRGQVEPLEIRFIHEYMQDGDRRKSAIRAGIPPRNATKKAEQFLRNRLVLEEIEKKRAHLSAKTGVDAEYILRSVRAIYEHCMQ